MVAIYCKVDTEKDWFFMWFFVWGIHISIATNLNFNFFSPLIENRICLFCYFIPTSSQLYHTCCCCFFFCISSNLCKYMKVNMKKLKSNVPRTWLLSLHRSMNFLSALSNFQALFSVTYFKMKALITTIIIVYRSVTLLKLSQNWKDWWHLSTLLSMWYLRTIICGFFWLKRCL